MSLVNFIVIIAVSMIFHSAEPYQNVYFIENFTTSNVPEDGLMSPKAL